MLELYRLMSTRLLSLCINWYFSKHFQHNSSCVLFKLWYHSDMISIILQFGPDDNTKFKWKSLLIREGLKKTSWDCTGPSSAQLKLELELGSGNLVFYVWLNGFGLAFGSVDLVWRIFDCINWRNQYFLLHNQNLSWKWQR